MDPNQALKNIREADKKLRCALTFGELNEVVMDLVEAVSALDGWLSRGGFLPDDWRQ